MARGKPVYCAFLPAFLSPTMASVYFQAQNISQHREVFHQHLLYLGHLPGVKDEMTAQENLEFNLALHGLDSDTAETTLS